MNVIGLGSGRCGTKTLAKLLDGCDYYSAKHEPGNPLPWRINKTRFENHQQKLDKYDAIVALYYGRYWELFDNANFIVLQRDKWETIQSFLDITPGRDHWSDPADEIWDQAFPSYNDLDKPNSISRYYRNYYEMMPDDALWVKTKNLSDKETQDKIFDVAEIPEKDRNYQDLVANKRENHLGYRN